MTMEDYTHLAERLRRYSTMHEAMRSAGEIDSEEDLERQAAEAIEELIENAEKRANIIRVETPLGTLIARPSYGEPDYPGIYIDIRRTDADQDLLLALVEFTATEADLPGIGHIVSRVYGDSLADEYTDRVVHEGIEDYFRMEEVEPKEGYIVLCCPTQALGMIVDLGNGPATENGDRSSQYFAIAKGRQHIDRTVSVALIENIHGLTEGEG